MICLLLYVSHKFYRVKRLSESLKYVSIKLYPLDCPATNLLMQSMRCGMSLCWTRVRHKYRRLPADGRTMRVIQTQESTWAPVTFQTNQSKISVSLTRSVSHSSFKWHETGRNLIIWLMSCGLHYFSSLHFTLLLIASMLTVGSK